MVWKLTPKWVPVPNKKKPLNWSAWSFHIPSMLEEPTSWANSIAIIVNLKGTPQETRPYIKGLLTTMIPYLGPHRGLISRQVGIGGLIFLRSSWCHIQGSLYYQPKQCIAIREIPQNYHTFALFDSPQMGNLMIPDICHPLFMDRNAHLALVPTMIQQGQHRRPNSHDPQPRSPGPQGKTDTHNVGILNRGAFCQKWNFPLWQICL